MVWKGLRLKDSSKRKGQFCNCSVEKPRYARAVRDPVGQSLVERDYDSQHPARAWPAGTEYQHAYCSHYTPPHDRQKEHQQLQQQRFGCVASQYRDYHKQQEFEREQDCIWHCNQREQDPYYDVHQKHERQQRYHKEQRQCPCSNKTISEEEQLQTFAHNCLNQQGSQYMSDNEVQCQPSSHPYTNHVQQFTLYETVPPAILDKHVRGAHYTPGEPLGQQVPEELPLGGVHGPQNSSRVRENMDNVYLPLYRYKDWVQRSEYEVYQDSKAEAAICKLPDAPTQYWDFYNEVRMRRPKRDFIEGAQYKPCRTIPIPRDTDLEHISSATPYDPISCQYGRFNDYKFEDAAFKPQSMCRC